MSTDRIIQTSPILVNIRDAAKLLGLSTKTIWSLSEPRGRLPVVRIGRRTMYEVAKLAEFAASQRQGGA